jgi:hypothetical protein
MKREGKCIDGMTRSLTSAGEPHLQEDEDGGRVAYKKGGSAQPNYKSGEMHKCMPN